MNIQADQIRNLLQRYEKIQPGDFHGCIAFFERNEDRLEHLDDEIYISIYDDYLQCLYTAGHYNKYFDRCDYRLRVTLASDREFERERYIDLLYRKAVSAHYTLRWNQCKDILGSVLNLQADHKPSQKLYALNHKRDLKTRFKWVYAVIIALLLVMTIILTTEIFVMDAFIDQYEGRVSWIRYTMLISAMTLLLGLELVTTLSGKWQLRRYLRSLTGTANP